jgi:hypothetical protein
MSHPLIELIGALADDSKKAFDRMLERGPCDTKEPGARPTAGPLTQLTLLAALSAPAATSFQDRPATAAPSPAKADDDMPTVADSLGELPHLLQQLTHVVTQLSQTLPLRPSVPDALDKVSTVAEPTRRAVGQATETASNVAGSTHNAASETVRKVNPLGW